VIESRHGRTIVLGLGNPVLSDDKVGLAVAEEVQRLLEASHMEGVDVMTASRAGFHLIDLLSGYERAILVDCYAPGDPVPGRIRRLAVSDVAGVARLVSVHDISAAEAFQAAALLGLPMPADVEIYTVDGADTSSVSESMTPAVEAAVKPLACDIVALCSSRRKVGSGSYLGRARRDS